MAFVSDDTILRKLDRIIELLEADRKPRPVNLSITTAGPVDSDTIQAAVESGLRDLIRTIDEPVELAGRVISMKSDG